MNFEYDYCLKFVVIGEACSGKTSFVSRICNNDFRTSYEPTIGVEFNSMLTKYKDYILKIQFWDTAGDKCFAPIVKTYYKNVAGIYLVLDLTCRNSIRKLQYWFKEINENKSENVEFKLFVIGNKCLSKKRLVSKEEIEDILKPRNIDYVEVSALNNENVLEVNDKMIEYIFNNFDVDNHRGIRSSKQEIIKLREKNNKNERDRFCCCIC